MGRLDAAREDARRAAEIRREISRETVDALGEFVGSGWIHIAEIDGAPAPRGSFVEAARRGVETAEKFGAVWTRVASLTNLASACLVEQQFGGALEATDAAMALSQERMTGADLTADLSNTVAQARLGLGDVDGSSAAAREGIETAMRTGHRIAELLCRIALARALLASGDTDSAREQLETANATIDATGAEAYRAFLLIERATLARLGGDERAREQCLIEARERFDAIPAPVRVEQVEALLREVTG